MIIKARAEAIEIRAIWGLAPKMMGMGPIIKMPPYWAWSVFEPSTTIAGRIIRPRMTAAAAVSLLIPHEDVHKV